MTIEQRTKRVREVAKKLPPLVDRGRNAGRAAAAPVTARLKSRRAAPPSPPRTTGTP